MEEGDGLVRVGNGGRGNTHILLGVTGSSTNVCRYYVTWSFHCSLRVA